MSFPSRYFRIHETPYFSFSKLTVRQNMSFASHFSTRRWRKADTSSPLRYFYEQGQLAVHCRQWLRHIRGKSLHGQRHSRQSSMTKTEKGTFSWRLCNPIIEINRIENSGIISQTHQMQMGGTSFFIGGRAGTPDGT